MLTRPALNVLVLILASELVARLGSGPERDVWISSRRLELAPERIAALAALVGGWAVVREPCEPLPAETFAWARPTIVLPGEPPQRPPLD